MPLHLTRIQEFEALPDPAEYVEGFPLVHEGSIYTLRAGAWEVAASAGGGWPEEAPALGFLKPSVPYDLEPNESVSTAWGGFGNWGTSVLNSIWQVVIAPRVDTQLEQWWEFTFPQGLAVDSPLTFDTWHSAGTGQPTVTVLADEVQVGDDINPVSGDNLPASSFTPTSVERIIPEGTETLRIAISWPSGSTNGANVRFVVASRPDDQSPWEPHDLGVLPDFASLEPGHYWIAGDVWHVRYDDPDVIWSRPTPNSELTLDGGVAPRPAIFLGGRVPEGFNPLLYRHLSVAIGGSVGSGSDVVVGGSSPADAGENVVLGVDAELDGDSTRSIVAGESGYVVARSTIALGKSVYVENWDGDTVFGSTVIGTFAGCEADEAVVIGADIWVSRDAERAVIVGTDAAAHDARGTTVGYSAVTDGVEAAAFGAYADASHDQSVALGANTTTTADDQVAVGDRDLEIQPADQSATPRGLIMQSPDGTRWRLTVDNNGDPVFTDLT